MEDYAIKFEHVSKIYKLKKKNDGKSKSSVTQRFYALNCFMEKVLKSLK